MSLESYLELGEKVSFAGTMFGGQKERALTSPKTSALAFISVLPWRINDGQILAWVRATLGCISLVKPFRGCDKSFSNRYSPKKCLDCAIELSE